MPTALTIVFVGCTIFLSHWFASLFARTKVHDIWWRFTISPLRSRLKPVDFGAARPALTAYNLVATGLVASTVTYFIPAQQHVPGGETIQSIVFSIILCATLLTTMLTFLVDKTWLSNIYELIFRLTGLNGSRPKEVKEEVIREEVR